MPGEPEPIKTSAAADPQRPYCRRQFRLDRPKRGAGPSIIAPGATFACGSRAGAGPGAQGTSRCALAEVEKMGPATPLRRTVTSPDPFFLPELGWRQPLCPRTRAGTPRHWRGWRRVRWSTCSKGDAGRCVLAAPRPNSGCAIRQDRPPLRGRDRHGAAAKTRKGLGRSGAEIEPGARASGHPPDLCFPSRHDRRRPTVPAHPLYLVRVRLGLSYDRRTGHPAGSDQITPCACEHLGGDMCPGRWPR